MVVKTGIISCSRLSGLIRVLFIRVNWYLKSFPLQWQGFFTLNYLGSVECGPACAARREKTRHVDPQSHCGNVNLYAFLERLHSPLFVLNRSPFFNILFPVMLCRILAWSCINRSPLSHGRAPVIRPISYLPIIFHSQSLVVLSHSLAVNNQ